METLADRLNDRLLRVLHEGNTLHAEVVKRGDGFTPEELTRIEAMKGEAADLRSQIDAERTLRELEDQRQTLAEAGRVSAGDVRRNQPLEATEGTPQDPDEFFRQLARAPRNVTEDGQPAAALDIDHTQAVREHLAVRRGASRDDIVDMRRAYLERVVTQDKTTNNSPQFGHTIQTDVANMIYGYMLEFGGIRRAGPLMITSPDGAPLNLPRVTARYPEIAGASAAATAENTEAIATESRLGALDLIPSKYTGRYDATRELLQNANVGIADFITADIGLTLGWKSESAYATAFVAGIPAANRLTVDGAAAANNPDFTQLQIEALPFELNQAYVRQPERLTWMAHQGAYKRVIAFRDGNTRPYYRRGEPVEGSVFELNNLLPNPGVDAEIKNKDFVFIADMRDYFVIRDVGGIRLRATSEGAGAFENDRTVYIGDLQTAGAVLHSVAGAAIRGDNN